MLSKVSVMILGLIAEKPLNPYELTKLLGYLHIKDWFPVAASSVYATIKTLHKKGYITGESIKEGKMPEKTVYTISEKGREEFVASLEEYLGSTELDAVQFNIACILICHIDKDKAAMILNTRMERFKKIKESIDKEMTYLKAQDGFPALGLISMIHNCNLIEAEINTIIMLMQEVEKSWRWNYFVTGESLN